MVVGGGSGKSAPKSLPKLALDRAVTSTPPLSLSSAIPFSPLLALALSREKQTWRQQQQHSHRESSQLTYHHEDVPYDEGEPQAVPARVQLYVTHVSSTYSSLSENTLKLSSEFLQVLDTVERCACATSSRTCKTRAHYTHTQHTHTQKDAYTDYRKPNPSVPSLSASMRAVWNCSHESYSGRQSWLKLCV